MILVIDNYDSFTWNLVHALALASRPGDRPDAEIRVVRNDALRPGDPRRLGAAHIVLSPGPCGPREAGVCIDLIRENAGAIPILGVCLGHQAIAEAFGMRVGRAPTPVHGKACELAHDGRGVFDGLPSPLRAGRYHSLATTREAIDTASDDLGRWETTAWTTDRTPAGTAQVVMGLRRVWNDPARTAVEGVQFHPESYLTEHGVAMLRNFLRVSAPSRVAPRPDTIVPAR